MTLGDYAQEVADYLLKKLPDVNVATLLEIAEFVTAKTCNYTQDEIKRTNEEWNNRQKRMHDLYLDYIKRM